MSHSTHGDSHDVHGEHHTSLWLYLYVFLALCVLTSASFFTYSDAWPFKGPDQQWVGWTFMMAVSCTKALLVILFFMHVKYEKSWKYVLTIPTAMMAIFLVLMLVPDIGRRTLYYSEERLQHTPRPPEDVGDEANAEQAGAQTDQPAAEARDAGH